MHDIIDQILVISLSITAIVSLIFLVFVIPILVQMARAFELVNSLLTLTKNSASEVSLRVSGAAKNAEKLSNNIYSNIVACKEAIKAFFH